MDLPKTQIKGLKARFMEYLEEMGGFSPRTIETYATDAFFPLRHNIGIDFWECLKAENGLTVIEAALLKHFELNRTKSVKPEHRTKGYMTSISHFRDFLVERHPNLL